MNKTTKYRRDLHKIPELSLKEYKTSQYLKDTLTEMGYTPFSLLETDVLVFIDNHKEETVAFRSDIDALPVLEETGVDFLSTHKGNMHACGHDGHMAMLLTFADYLKDKQDKLNTNILLIFQPAEESIGGAKLLVDKGLLSSYNVQKVFGIHLFPEIPQGTIASRSGEFMARASEVTIKIKGKTAHGAMPQLGIDSNIVLAKLLLDFQTIQTRNLSPLEYSIITFGRIEGGTVRNVISDLGVLEGTVRAFNNDTFDTIIHTMKQICHGYEQSYGVTIDFHNTEGYLPVINDPALYKEFKQAIKGIPYHEFDKPLMIAEDFSFYQNEIPGVFFFVGTKNEELGYIHSLHNSKFNFDEEALLLGVKAYKQIIKHLGIINE
jgi:hippurate hydrolase